MRVALKVIRGGEAEDSRSDDEGSDNDEEQEESGEAEEGRSSSQKARGVIEVSPPPLEEEVGVEAINLASSSSPKKSSGSSTNTHRFSRKTSSHASGVHLPSDTKGLLGRIGCDKGS